MPQISFTLSGVDISDAEDIARYVLVPAMQNGPLYRTMFPQSDTVTKQQRDEIVRWYTDMLEDAFEDRWESFLKASSPNGTPIGFCAWTIEQDRGRQTDEQPRRQKRKKGTWIPETIDINSWTTLSKASRAERNRVLQNDTDICRKMISRYNITLYDSSLTSPTSRLDIYGGRSETSTARNRFLDDAADLRRD